MTWRVYFVRSKDAQKQTNRNANVLNLSRVILSENRSTRESVLVFLLNVIVVCNAKKI